MPAAALAATAAPLPAGTRLDASSFACHGEEDAVMALPEGWAFGDEEDLHACHDAIRPGSPMSAPVGCTMNWVVRDAAGQLYIGTAGHCVAVGRRVSVSGLGPIGTVVFNGQAQGIDFALVKIDASKYEFVDPTLCHWGGPSSAGVAQIGDPLLVYGFGTVYQTTSATRARTGVAQSNNVGTLQYVGTMQPGDSGAPVMTADGVAVGIHVRSFASVPGTSVRVDPSPKFATRADVAFAAAGAALGTTITLVPSETPVDLAATLGR